MLGNTGNNRGELAKVEATLQEVEARLGIVSSLLKERKAERMNLEVEIREVATDGYVDRLMALQSRSMALDSAIAELDKSEQEWLRKLEAVRRYLYTLYVRLERLREEAADLAEKIADESEAQGESSAERTYLSRLKVQIQAITGG